MNELIIRGRGTRAGWQRRQRQYNVSPYQFRQHENLVNLLYTMANGSRPNYRGGRRRSYNRGYNGNVNNNRGQNNQDQGNPQ